MMQEEEKQMTGTSRQEEEAYLCHTLTVVRENVEKYTVQERQTKADIDEMLEHYHDDDPEIYTLLNNTITMHEYVKRTLEQNEKALKKPYFGRIVYHDELLNRKESLYIGKGGISVDATHQIVIDWRAPVATVYYENSLGKCSYTSPGGEVPVDLKMKRTYEIEEGKLLDYFDTEVIANDELLTKYLAKNKQAVLGEIVATIQKEQNEIIRRSPYHNLIVQGVAGSGKTTVAMHRISYILYNYAERFRPDDFYIVGSNRILLNYITSVLPDLDVYGVRQMTMEQLFVRLLYEVWDEKKYRIRSGSLQESAKEPQMVNRGCREWFRELKAFCDRVEWDSILRESVYLNPRKFVEGIRDGKSGVYDETENREENPRDRILLVSKEAVESYIRESPTVSVQRKINMLNERLMNKVRDEITGKAISYTEAERKAILRAYRGRYGGKVWKRSVYDLYRGFLREQRERGKHVPIPDEEFDVYDLAALAYLYKRFCETQVISEAHHIVIDEAQDFGMMVYEVLNFCVQDCTYTVMGDVSQNIHFGHGLNDWEELKDVLLKTNRASFQTLRKSYRNTVEISEFAANILAHGHFASYPAEPVIRHGSPVLIQKADKDVLAREAAQICKRWQDQGYETIAVICRDEQETRQMTREMSRWIEVMDNDLGQANFGIGILVLSVEYTKGLEFDAVLIPEPTREAYPVKDGHAKLLYVAATRALHELCVLHSGDLTGLINDPLSENANVRIPDEAQEKRTAGQPVEEKKPEKAATRYHMKKRAQVESDLTPAQALLNEKLRQGSSEKQQGLSSAFQKTSGAPRRLDPVFGAMPTEDCLRPVGHARIDMTVRWVTRKEDGLYFQSRYGMLRLSPISAEIVRVTFVRSGPIKPGVHPRINQKEADRYWLYREKGSTVDMMTDELLIRMDKTTGALSYMTRDRQLLLTERAKECRQMEPDAANEWQAWLYLNWQKAENLYAIGQKGRQALPLRNTSRYLSGGGKELPFLISDKGYGIVLATDAPAFCCDRAPYGSYLMMEKVPQMDFYFLRGESRERLMQLYGELCQG